MSTLREAARQALEALNQYTSKELTVGQRYTNEGQGLLEAINVLDAALAEPEQEPVFWYRPVSDGGYEGPIYAARMEQVRKESGAWKPLYIHPEPTQQPDTIVVTKTDAGQIVAVTRQHSDGRVIEVIAESTR